MVDVGLNRRNNDGSIFSSLVIDRSLRARRLNISADKSLPSKRNVLPHVIIGAEAFPLLLNLKRPYLGEEAVDESLYPRNLGNQTISFKLCYTHWLFYSINVIVSAADCRSKWTALRNNFCKAMRKRKTTCGQAATKVKP